MSATLEFFTGWLGFRLEMIMPADSPSIAVISGYGVTVRLENGQSETIPSSRLRLHCDYEELKTLEYRQITAPGGIQIEFVEWPSPVTLRRLKPEFLITRASDENVWTEGRAGMQYRDLIPGNLGGAVIASHIRIPEGGETPDYVHYHRVLFQMIYCNAGCARLVYEDQGPPFIMNAGDCVLQPPGIRHRVLETSPGFEVIEVGCPAVHETFADHDMKLPTPGKQPDRLFSGQYFLHDKAKNAEWIADEIDGCEVSQTGIMDATEGLADVHLVRNLSRNHAYFHGRSHNDIVIMYVLSGYGDIRIGENDRHQLSEGDCCSLPSHSAFRITGKKGFCMLIVSLKEKE